MRSHTPGRPETLNAVSALPQPHLSATYRAAPPSEPPRKLFPERGQSQPAPDAHVLGGSRPSSAPPGTHLARDASDERHLPGLAHLAIPGAPGAGAACRSLCRSLCHVPARRAAESREERQRAQWRRLCQGTWECNPRSSCLARLQGSAHRAASRHNLTGSSEAGGKGRGRAQRRGNAAARLQPGGRGVIP